MSSSMISLLSTLDQDDRKRFHMKWHKMILSRNIPINKDYNFEKYLFLVDY